MSMRGIIKGLIVSVLSSVAFLLLLALVSYFSNIMQEYLNIAMYVCMGASVMLGAIVCASISKRKILQNCLIFSLAYIILLVLATLIKNGTIGINIRFFATCAGILASSVVGSLIANRNFV